MSDLTDNVKGTTPEAVVHEWGGKQADEVYHILKHVTKLVIPEEWEGHEAKAARAAIVQARTFYETANYYAAQVGAWNTFALAYYRKAQEHALDALDALAVLHVALKAAGK